MLRNAWETILSTGPILRRELIGLLRSRRAFWMAVLTVAGTGLIPLLAWPAEGSETAFVNARSAFQTYQGVAFAALYLFVPVISGSAISAEREQGTYELLLATRLSPGGIVVGKMLSIAGFFVLLLALTFPVAVLLFLLGGFEPGEFGRTLLYLALFIIMISQQGLLGSLKQPSSVKAIPLAFALSFGLVIPFAQALANLPIARIFLPFFAGVFLVLPLSLILADAWPRLLEPPVPPPLPSLSRGYSGWGKSWPVSRLVERSRTGIPDGWNPVLVVAVRNGPAAVWSSVPALAIAAAIALPVLLVLTIGGKPAMAMTIAASAVLFAAALALPALASLITVRDLDRGRLDLLRSTPLTPLELLKGHLEAALLAGSCFFLFSGAVCLVFLPFCLLQDTWMISVMVLPALAVVALVASTAGILAAVVAGATQRALVLAYLLALGLLLGIPYVVGLRAPFSTAFSPLSGCIHACWEIANLRKETFAGLFFVSLAVGLTISSVQFGLAVAIFGKRWMRDR